MHCHKNTNSFSKIQPPHSGRFAQVYAVLRPLCLVLSSAIFALLIYFLSFGPALRALSIDGTKSGRLIPLWLSYAYAPALNLWASSSPGAFARVYQAYVEIWLGSTQGISGPVSPSTGIPAIASAPNLRSHEAQAPPSETHAFSKRPRTAVSLQCAAYSYFDEGFQTRLTATSVSPEQLNASAQQYLHHKQPNVILTNFTSHVLIPRDARALAFIWYASTSGKPGFLIPFDFNRRPLNLTTVPHSGNPTSLPFVVLGVQITNVTSGFSAEQLQHRPSPEALASAVRSLFATTTSNIDFSMQQTLVVVPADRAILAKVACDFGNWRADLTCTFDYDLKAKIISLSPQLGALGFRLTPDGDLVRR